jgi:hypothetical protein
MRLKTLLDGVSSFLPPPLIFIIVDRGPSASEIGEVTWNRHWEELWRSHVEGKRWWSSAWSLAPIALSLGNVAAQ